MGTDFTQRIKHLIRSIPRGTVATYGQIAAMAGSPLGARQVAYILHSSSRKDKLPWHRVINSKGTISLKPNYGYEVQRGLLMKEGIRFDAAGVVDLERYLWQPLRKRGQATFPTKQTRSHRGRHT